MAIKIALAQYPITRFSSKEDWREHISQWVEQAHQHAATVMVFPEYGSMELTAILPDELQSDLHAQIASMQHLLPDFQETFRKLAQKWQCVIVAPSFPVQTDNGFVNRAYVFSPNGEGYQDKWFMTRFENEIWGISSGSKELAVFEWETWRFGIQICYDVEFPIGAQLLAAAGVQVIFAPSCTETIRGATRVHVGARARAMEQQIYSAVSQTINEALWSPAVDINYGFAGVYSSPDRNLPEEGILSTGTPELAGWHYEELDFSLNEEIRCQGQVFNFQDSQRQQLSLQEKVIIKHIQL